MTLAVWQRTIVDDAGNVLAGASVEVRVEASGNLAVLKADRAGATGKDNPFTVGLDGFAQFFAVGGAYRITATSGAFSKTWNYVPIGTAAETDLPVGRRRTVTAAGDVTVGADDERVIIKKESGEATSVIIPPAADRNMVDIIIKDGKGDADVNSITPVFDGSETCDGLAGTALKITTPYGYLWLAPLEDGSGYYQMPSQL
jgi:hypothetical protein